MRLRDFLFAGLLGLASLAQAATTIPGDVTGMWLDARHPGWGVGLVQQNDAVFATLFTYDAGGMPLWLVASRLEGNGINFDPCGTMALTGTLYRTQWPSFGSAANPQGSLQVQTVGTITVSVATQLGSAATGCDRNSASLQYSIDGVQTAVTVTRLAWTSKQARLYGQFAGALSFGTPAAPCADLNASSVFPVSSRQLVINGSADAASPGGVRLIWGTGIDTACDIRGTYSQGGQLGTVAGTLSCGPIGFDLMAMGPVRVSSLYIGDSGFVGDVVLDIGSCRYMGTVSGARRFF